VEESGQGIHEGGEMRQIAHELVKVARLLTGANGIKATYTYGPDGFRLIYEKKVARKDFPQSLQILASRSEDLLEALKRSAKVIAIEIKELKFDDGAVIVIGNDGITARVSVLSRTSPKDKEAAKKILEQHSFEEGN